MSIAERLSLLLICFSLLTGCVSVPKCQSNWVSKNTSESSYRFYDPKSKIRYNLENDSTHFFIILDVMDVGTKLRILRTGSRLNFSMAGKKKPQAQLEFPFLDPETPIAMDASQQHMMPRDGSAHELRKILPKQGLFYETDSVNIPLISGVETQSIFVEMEIDNSGVLIYKVQVPLDELVELGTSFNFGFETGAFKIDDPEYERQMQETGAEGLDRTAGFSQNRTMNPGSPMGTNQPYGNVYQPGMGNDPHRAAPPRLGVRSALSDPISFWVQVDLSSSPLR